MGLVALTGAIWVLAKTLGNINQPLYAGKPAAYWQAQLGGHDAGASNRAFAVLNSQIIPQLTDLMFHDTKDSGIRTNLIDALNGLPGVEIYFTPASERRGRAAEVIGEFGPAAKSAVPALMQALKGPDKSVYEGAIKALGNIHTDPDVVIPLLMTFLNNDDLNDEAAIALANYGPLAKAAVPKIIPLLHAADDDAQAAAQDALLKIDPEAAEKAGVKRK